jgi:hypothetical protein
MMIVPDITATNSGEYKPRLLDKILYKFGKKKSQYYHIGYRPGLLDRFWAKLTRNNKYMLLAILGPREWCQLRYGKKIEDILPASQSTQNQPNQPNQNPPSQNPPNQPNQNPPSQNQSGQNTHAPKQPCPCPEEVYMSFISAIEGMHGVSQQSETQRNKDTLENLVKILYQTQDSQDKILKNYLEMQKQQNDLAKQQYDLLKQVIGSYSTPKDDRSNNLNIIKSYIEQQKRNGNILFDSIDKLNRKTDKMNSYLEKIAKILENQKKE